jgi:hypothetical protein
VRWNIKISKDTDIAVRSFLARAGFKKGDLSKFVEEAVRWRVARPTASFASVQSSASSWLRRHAGQLTMGHTLAVGWRSATQRVLFRGLFLKSG